jgi:hypothetical protein
MHTEPQDAIPPEYQTPTAPDPKAAMRARLAENHQRNLRTSARIVGVRISDDMTEIWSHGIGKPHYPLAGAHCTYEERTGTLVFETDGYELVVDVPKAARRYARKFAGEFNTWIKQQP